MKIQKLIEAKFSPSSYAYHATNMDYLRSILKHGLVPNKMPSTGYGSSEVSYNFGYSLNALPGVYFTTDIRHAEHIAKQIDGTGLIVIAKVQKQSATMDEDFLSGLLDESNILNAIRKHEKSLKDNFDQFVTNVTDNIIRNNFPPDLNPQIIKNVRPDLKEYITVLTKLQGTGEAEHWTRQQVDDTIKKLRISLTNKLRRFVQNKNSTHDTFKINDTIGFSGANRIVGFYNYITNEGWGDLGEFERYAYHKVKTPMELIRH